MKDPESRTIFVDVDGRTDTELPEWYQQRQRGDDLVTFAEAIRDLPQAVNLWSSPMDGLPPTHCLGIARGCRYGCSYNVSRLETRNSVGVG